ncbi:MAG: dehydrogenase E1 component subunit alpha/beta [Lentisphaerae bacterium]|nr:dehydrogenase E1 component subunit alpha/beta [Lentisphaerota bacterium]
MPNYLSNTKPNFKPYTIDCGEIKAYQCKKTVKSELATKNLTKQQAFDILEDMLTIREFEEMIIKLRSGAYDPCSHFDYRGPTHVSIGQEAASVGACVGIAADDYITSTHRGHGDSVAKGCAAIRAMTVEQLKKRVPGSTNTDKKKLMDEALDDHVYRTIAELFGKEDGYCKGRGGGMHIADFTVGHLGANAIVGGGVPIATGAAMAERYLRQGKIVCCFAGDGAYANGVVLESLNWSTMAQFTNKLAKDSSFGLPVIYLILNNHYGMTGRADNEVMGVRSLARRAAGFAENNMHAEVVNGMDVIAVRDAVTRAAKGCRQGKGPYLIELNTYRYYGHSLSDPRNEYRMREEETAWKKIDPIDTFSRQLISAGVLTKAGFETLKKRVADRNARAAIRAAESADPDPKDVIKYMYTNTSATTVPDKFSKVSIIKEKPEIKRADGQLTYKDAIKEALLEEMIRDRRVILYGEDVADYGGAFKVTKGLLEAFGRNRVFNSPISEAAICGTAIGAAMIGLRPIVELMYMDFALMASDQISNQAAKWHYMSGANVEVPVVYRVSVGGGKGYGGQHSQTLESMFAHIPGMYVAYPATPNDVKGLLKTAIRDNNPIMFVESQLLYGVKGVVPEKEYLIPFGQADVKRQGKDITIVTWGPAVHDSLKAAESLAPDIDVEVVDIRTLVPLDINTIIRSVKKTGRCVVASQCISIGSFAGEIASTIMEQAFDYLDAPVARIGAKNGIAPQSHILEAAFLPNANDIAQTVKQTV